jgi:hypothetical protein
MQQKEGSQVLGPIEVVNGNLSELLELHPDLDHKVNNLLKGNQMDASAELRGHLFALTY